MGFIEEVIQSIDNIKKIKENLDLVSSSVDALISYHNYFDNSHNPSIDFKDVHDIRDSNKRILSKGLAEVNMFLGADTFSSGKV